jgi:hypothetical protein
MAAIPPTPPPAPPAQAPQPDTPDGGLQNTGCLPSPLVIAMAVGIMLIIIAIFATVFGMRGGDAIDFTAVDAAAQAKQQVCFDEGLFYDELGSCYSIDPGLIVVENRAQFIVEPGPSDEATDTAVPGDSTTQSSGQANPGTSSGGSTGPTGPKNPSTTTNSGQADPGSSTGSTGQTDPGSTADTDTDTGTTTTADTDTDTGTTTTADTDTDTGTTTTTPTETATETKTEPTAPTPEPIVTTNNDEWVFRFTPDEPSTGCEGDEGRETGSLSQECTDYKSSRGGSESFQCTHSSDGTFTCPKQNDGNQDQAVNGTVTRDGISLTKTKPEQDQSKVGYYRMRGTTVKDGSIAGEICEISGRFEHFLDGSATANPRVVEGSWSARRNASGC